MSLLPVCLEVWHYLQMIGCFYISKSTGESSLFDNFVFHVLWGTEEPLSECVKSGYSPEWMYIVDIGMQFEACRVPVDSEPSNLNKCEHDKHTNQGLPTHASDSRRSKGRIEFYTVACECSQPRNTLTCFQEYRLHPNSNVQGRSMSFHNRSYDSLTSVPIQTPHSWFIKF